MYIYLCGNLKKSETNALILYCRTLILTIVLVFLFCFRKMLFIAICVCMCCHIIHITTNLYKIDRPYHSQNTNTYFFFCARRQQYIFVIVFLPHANPATRIYRFHTTMSAVDSFRQIVYKTYIFFYFFFSCA